MKKILLSLVMVLTFAMTANAEVQEVGELKIDVPAGWNTNAQGPVAMLMSGDMTSVVTVIVGPNEGKNAEFLATEASKGLSGSSVSKEGDGYAFDFESQGQKGKMLVRVIGDKAVISTMIGADSSLMNIAKSATPK